MRKHRKHKKEMGKKAVYMTEFRNAAVEVRKMYERKGVAAVVEAEKGEHGATIYVVYLFLGG